jgi:hypothetical protein
MSYIIVSLIIHAKLLSLPNHEKIIDKLFFSAVLKSEKESVG